MSNYNIKLNLIRIHDARRMEIKGRDCIVIPIDNRFGAVTDGYTGKDGVWHMTDVYLNLQAIEMREPRYGETHLIKQSLSRDCFVSMTEEQQRQLPIIGSLKPNAPRPQQQPQQPAPTVDPLAPNDDDLPW